MDDRLAALQLRIRALRRGQAVSQIRYPEDLRADIVAAGRAAKAAGARSTASRETSESRLPRPAAQPMLPYPK